VSKQLGLPAYRIPQQPERRAKLARSLMRTSDDKCLARIESGAPPDAADAHALIAPRKLHEIPMIYPRTAANLSIERRFTLKMAIGEDGFPWPIGVADGPVDDEFAITALGSVPLWRFTPLIIGGCPAPMRITTVPVTFLVR
jgi:outer membrane biosynthesis protein TonB